MKGWFEHTGGAITILRDDIDTDQLLPKQFMKLIDKKNFGNYLFYHWRYIDSNPEKLNVNFVLNRIQKENPSILVTGKNFGCGSSREHAVWALSDYGFKVIIGQSFGDIFAINAAKNGIALISLEDSLISEIMNWSTIDKDVRMRINLIEKKIFYKNFSIAFDMEESQRERIFNGKDDIDETMEEAHRIDVFIQSYLNENTYLVIK